MNQFYQSYLLDLSLYLNGVESRIRCYGQYQLPPLRACTVDVLSVELLHLSNHISQIESYSGETTLEMVKKLRCSHSLWCLL